MKETDTTNLLIFIQLVILGLKSNPNYPGLGAELEKMYNETFKEKL